jgi:hypothetical protein
VDAGCMMPSPRAVRELQRVCRSISTQQNISLGGYRPALPPPPPGGGGGGGGVDRNQDVAQCSSVAFLFEPKLQTKTNLPGGRWPLVEVITHTTMREELPEEGVVRRNTTEARLSNRTTYHHVSHGNEITRTRRTRTMQELEPKSSIVVAKGQTLH